MFLNVYQFWYGEGDSYDMRCVVAESFEDALNAFISETERKWENWDVSFTVTPVDGSPNYPDFKWIVKMGFGSAWADCSYIEEREYHVSESPLEVGKGVLMKLLSCRVTAINDEGEYVNMDFTQDDIIEGSIDLVLNTNYNPYGPWYKEKEKPEKSILTLKLDFTNLVFKRGYGFIR